MIKYKLKDNPIETYSFNYLGDYLRSLGIENPDSFIKQPRPEDEESFEKLENIFELVDSLYEGFKNNKKFFLQVDSDTDGYTSSAIFYGFFKKLFPEAKIEWRLHEGKEHGIILDTIPIDADYVVIPDAGSMQFDEQEQLSIKGYKVLIMDHHNLSTPPKLENVIIVNNQLSPRFTNKNLSGAGVVYKVIQAFCSRYKDEFPAIYPEFADLAALGIVSDMMDTRNLDNNFIINKGLKNIHNSMFRALLEKQQYSIERSGGDIDAPNKINLAFYIAPLINAVIRFGTTEEKEELFRGFITLDASDIIETEYRGEIRRENYYDYIARVSGNIRARQNREKEKSMNFLIDRIESNKLHENQLIVVTVSKDDEVVVPHTITGLVAMELLKKYKKPTLVLRPKSDGNGGLIYAGSGRGKANGDFDSLFGMLRKSDLCEYVEGHDMAHGVAVKAENMGKLIEYANETLKDIEFDVEEIEVDYIFNNATINQEMIMQFGKVIDIYGNGIPQPKFAFKLNVAKSAINFIGKKQETMRISLNGVDFLKFGASDIYNEIQKNPSHLYELVMVGRAQVNEWNGRVTPQIMVDEAEIKAIGLGDLF